VRSTTRLLNVPAPRRINNEEFMHETADDRTALDVDDADFFANLNMPDDVSHWLSRAHHDRT
jgi:hypothetical protein